MKLSEVCIKQPVLSIVLSLVLVVLGLMGFQRLEIRFFPKIELPVVTIVTHYEGASAALMESQVTTIIENALAGIDGIQYISSSSWPSYSSITVQFRLGSNFEQQAAAVRDKVSGVESKLPPDSDPPGITVGAQGNPIIGIGFTDQTKSPADIRDYLIRTVFPLLRQLPGVGSVDVIGSSDYAMRIWLNAAKMASLGVTIEDVKNALTSNNIYFPAGVVQGPARNYSIVSNTQLKNANEFADIIIKNSDQGTIRFKDIGKVELGYRSLYDYPTRVGGRSGILVIIEPLQAANPITVAEEVHNAMHVIRQNLPPAMQANVTFDMSTYLKSSIHETFFTMGEAVFLVILVVFLFLGSLRAASIPIVTIPVSLIAVFAVINVLGFSINTMSLLGMVLAIGLVVDDSIVMLENIHRHIEEGLSPFKAALKGSMEIAFAVIAMSLTLLAVYAPIGFVQGFTAELFKEFAFTLASAVVISGFVALTLSPMMCSRILLSEKKESRFTKIVDYAFFSLSSGYQRVLRRALQYRHVIVVVLLFIGFGGYFLYENIHSEFIPQEDYGVMNVDIYAPTGSTLAYTDQNTKKVEAILKTIPQIKNFTTQVNTTSAQIRVTMQPWNERYLSTQQVIAELNPQLAKIPGINAVAYIPDVIDYGEKGSDVTLSLMTTGSYEDLLRPINTLMQSLRDYPGLENLQTDLKFDAQEYSITINRDLTAALGVNIQDVADTISAMMSGAHWTDVQSGNRSYEVIVQMQRKDLKNFNAINRLYVTGGSGLANVTGNKNVIAANSNNMIPLSSLIKLTPTIGQGMLHHFNRLRSGTITAMVAPGYTESQVLHYVLQKIPSALTANIRYAFSGKAGQFLEAAGSMTGIMLLAFVFIYLVLSAQFGSFIDPFIILLAVPLSLVGALFSLWIGNGTLNLYSQIGLVTLVGMISKHGILITQFINDLRKEGKEIREAIIKGAMIRLRPVLMTTSAMIFGTLPLVLARGSGSVGRHEIGWVIVGGLLFGTFFSLVVVPIAYSYIGRFRKIASRYVM